MIKDRTENHTMGMDKKHSSLLLLEAASCMTAAAGKNAEGTAKDET